MGDVLTIDDIRAAVEVLRANEVPTFEGGYFIHASFDTVQEIEIWANEAALTYRQRDLAWSLLRHERRRRDLGRRPDSPTADEILRRVVSA